MMRKMSLVSLVVAVVIGGAIVWGEGPPDIRSPDVYVFTLFLVAAFAPKAVQKFAEAHFPVSK